MRKPTGSMFVTGLWAAASVAAVSAHGPLAFKAGAWDIASKGGEDCHRSFPAFLWAGSNSGDQLQTGYRHSATDAHEVASMVVDAAGAAEELEVVVVVLSKGESFSTSGVSDANAAVRVKGDGETCLHAKSATATYPYTYPATSTLKLALPLFASEKEASVQELSLEDVIRTTVESGMLSDGKLDFVIATVPETATIEDTDAAVRMLTSSLEEKSNGRFLLLWTGDVHGPTCGRRSLAQEAAAHRRLQTEATSRTIKMTPDILAGLLFLLLFLFILVTGLGCVGDIECPQHFNHEKPAPGKDY
ncbi:unnamed protein product [Laminaria digitata]